MTAVAGQYQQHTFINRSGASPVPQTVVSSPLSKHGDRTRHVKFAPSAVSAAGELAVDDADISYKPGNRTTR